MSMNSVLRTICFVSAVTAGVLLSYSPLQAETILIDFGNDSSFRGVSTPSPDPNGNYWNSVWAGAFYADIDDINGNATDVDFGFSSETGNDYFNGPSGGTQDPAATVYNAAALGNLGVNEAVYDYYVNSTFEIQGLDPNKTYDLTFYGAHKFSADDTTVYSVYTDDTYTTLVDSVSLDVQTPGMPWLHNEDTVATISGLSPQLNNILYVQFAGAGGSSGYLNAMQIVANEAEVVPEPSAFGLLALAGMLASYRRSI